MPERKTSSALSGEASSGLVSRFGPRIIVDVVPTDSQGLAIYGLSKDDFQVGEKIDWATQVPQKITSLRIADRNGAQPAPAFRWQEPPDRSSDPDRGDPDNGGDSAAQITIVLIDALNSDFSAPWTRGAIAGLADFDCTQTPPDPACHNVPYAVLRLGKKLELLQDFSPDRDVLRSTLENAVAVPAEKPQVSDASSPSPKVAPANPVESALPPIRDWDRLPPAAKEPARRALMTLDALRSIARHLTGYPGRKRLIWIASSFAITILPEPCASGLDNASSCDSPAAALMNALFRARVSIYPIHLGSAYSPQYETASSQPGDARAAQLVERDDDLGVITRMRVLATQTGGAVCPENTPTGDCFRQALRDGVDDYELSYSPAIENWTPGFHRVNVTTSHPHLHLAFPKYYYVQRAQPASRDLDLKTTACDDLATATALKLSAELSPTASKFTLRIGGSSLTATPTQDEHRPLRLFLDMAVCAFDRSGRPLQHVQYSGHREMTVPEFEAIRAHGLDRVVDFQPAAETASLRWVVRDSQTGDAGSVDLAYSAPPSAPYNESDEPSSAAAGNAADTQKSEPQPAVAPSVAAGAPGSDPDADIRPYCTAIANTTDHSDALAAACVFTLALTRKMPNIICDLTTNRHWRSNDVPHHDVVTANVAYENGHENYENLKVNGKPPGSASGTANSSWSMGEFATHLEFLFSPASNTKFEFTGETKLHSVPALVFAYHIDEEDNVLYCLRAITTEGSSTSLFPTYVGAIWINKSNFQLMRLEGQTAAIPHGSRITRSRTEIDYSDLTLGDGSSFVLPIKSEVEVCSRSEGGECAHNVVRFNNCHKFRAKARVLPMQPE